MDSRPDILFVMSDDHASHAMSCYPRRTARSLLFQWSQMSSRPSR